MKTPRIYPVNHWRHRLRFTFEWDETHLYCVVMLVWFGLVFERGWLTTQWLAWGTQLELCWKPNRNLARGENLFLEERKFRGKCLTREQWEDSKHVPPSF